MKLIPSKLGFRSSDPQTDARPSLATAPVHQEARTLNTGHWTQYPSSQVPREQVPLYVSSRPASGLKGRKGQGKSQSLTSLG